MRAWDQKVPELNFSIEFQLRPLSKLDYKEIFSLIQDNRLWVDNTPMDRDLLFDVSEDYVGELVEAQKEDSSYRIVDGIMKARSQSIWFTNLDHAKRHEDLILYKTYSPGQYRHYDNYDAINVDKTAEIAEDYAGIMEVPIIFPDKYNPGQFEILGMHRPLITALTGKVSRFRIGGNEILARIVVRKKGRQI